MVEIDLDMLNWKKRVAMLNALEKVAKTRKEKKLVKMGWEHIWDVYPPNMRGETPISTKRFREMGF